MIIELENEFSNIWASGYLKEKPDLAG